MHGSEPPLPGVARDAITPVTEAHLADARRGYDAVVEAIARLEQLETRLADYQHENAQLRAELRQAIEHINAQQLRIQTLLEESRGR